uniref:Uncharacterized protein n=1 Tax=Entomoneis paludosa TaxID=265537 RepID=A0A7S2VG31_9STRA
MNVRQIVELQCLHGAALLSLATAVREQGREARSARSSLGRGAACTTSDQRSESRIPTIRLSPRSSHTRNHVHRRSRKATWPLARMSMLSSPPTKTTREASRRQALVARH